GQRRRRSRGAARGPGGRGRERRSDRGRRDRRRGAGGHVGFIQTARRRAGAGEGRARCRDEGRRPLMRSITDIFIRKPVLAIVLNLGIVLLGARAFTSLPVQQYPSLESTSVVITTVYYGASAEAVRGFLTVP